MDAVQGLFDRLCRYLSAYKPELFCTVPLVLLVLFGFCSAPWWAYAVVLVVLAMMVIICNPFHVWDRLLAPKSRLFMAAGILIALLPVSFYGVEMSAKLILWAIALGLWAVALWRRKLWLGLYMIQQSAEVDTVLAHLSHEADWQAGRAWERYGCREVRAVLHQTLYAICDEAEMQRTYMPVYFLGFLHGEAAAESQTRKAKAERAAFERQAYQIEQQQAEIERLENSNETLKEQLSQAQERYYEVGQSAKQLEQKMSHMTLQQDARDAAILDYLNEGHTLVEAGKKFGLSKSGISAAAKRARQAEKQDKE